MAEEIIRSRRNPKIKLARSLLQRRNARYEHRLFVVEGLRHVGAALEAHAPIAFLLWAPDRLTSNFGRHLVTQAQQARVPVYAVAADVLDSIIPRERSQGLVAVVHIQPIHLSHLTSSQHCWIAAVTAPQNPGNIGTLLRTLDAVGAHALILLDGGADPYHPSTVRASMGALFWVPVVQTDWASFRQWAHKQGYHLYGSSAHGTANYNKVSYAKPAALLLGNERAGLTPEQRDACETVVRLPMQGHGTSLNLAVAAGVLLYAMQAAWERNS